MPVTVGVSADGESVHESGPAAWKGKFAGIPVNVETGLPLALSRAAD